MSWEDDLGVSAAHLVAAAVRAPSSHNTQPWIFRVTPEGLELMADRTRALPVNDPHDRELVMSCAAALFNLRVAAAAEGLGAWVRVRPDPDRPDLLASVHVDADAGPRPELADLAPAIPRRRTYRKAFDDREVESGAAHELILAAREEGASLRVLEDVVLRDRTAELVAEGDAVQWSDPSWRRELAAWMHPRREGDGLAVPTLAAPIARLVVRTFDMGGGVAAKDQELADASPLLAVLATASDGVGDWLAAGQALERVLLTATMRGLQASYLNQPVQVPALRSRLADGTGVRFPQALLRFGYPEEELDPTPRRPVEEVLER